MPTNFPTAVDSFPTAATLAGHNLSTDPHSTLHGNLGLAVAAMEPVMLGPLVFNAKAYGATGDGVTSDTTAVNNAIAAAKAAGGGIVYFPPGIYLCGALTTIDFSGLSIVGHSLSASTIKSSATSLFTFETFSATPGAFFGGHGVLSFTDVTLDGNQTGTAEGSRTRALIIDNGAGNITVQRSRLRGAQYGFKGNYGSDFNRFDNLIIENCDVGIYLGEGCNQNVLTGVMFNTIAEGLVTDGVIQLNALGCTFVNAGLSAYTVEYRDVTRSGVTTPTDTGNTNNDGKILLKGCWFESTTRSPTNGFVYTFSDVDTTYPRGVHIEDTIGVFTSAGATFPFWKAHSGRFFVLSDLTIIGQKCSIPIIRTNATYLRQIRTRFEDGSPAVGLWSGANGTCTTEKIGGDILTFTSLDTTPTVQPTDYNGIQSTEVFKATNGSATSITFFDDGYIGQMIVVWCTNGNTTFVHGSGILTNTGANITAAANRAYQFVFDGTNWMMVT